MVLISILTCSFNPKKEYLQRVVDAISTQTIAAHNYEYVQVDNASTCFPELDLSRIYNLKLIKESKPGKINALLSGLRVCTGKLIIIVDDDNVIISDYLKIALKIYDEMPFLGVWGGQIYPEYEEMPTPELLPYTHLLTLSKFDRLDWSNVHTAFSIAGAGMCLRREVANRFQINVAKNSLALSLSRTGELMPGVEDWETAMAACDLGLGMGRIPDLKLTHIIPRRRVQKKYLLTLQENSAYAYQRYVCSRPQLISQRHWHTSRLNQFIQHLRDYCTDQTTREFRRAYRRGLLRAREFG